MEIPWNFSNNQHAEKAALQVATNNKTLLVGTVECAVDFKKKSGVNAQTVAMAHLEKLLERCKVQAKQGWCFIVFVPTSSNKWNHKVIENFIAPCQGTQIRKYLAQEGTWVTNPPLVGRSLQNTNGATEVCDSDLGCKGIWNSPSAVMHQYFRGLRPSSKEMGA